MRFPDNPKLVSFDFLKRLDDEAPGTWLAQPKLDGWRRVIDCNTWQIFSKHASGLAARPLPEELFAELRAIGWPQDTALDMEWMGTRSGAGKHSLWVFDLVRYGVPFKERYQLLSDMLPTQQSARINLVPCWPNPGLCDKYLEQMQDPLSEGLVVRRHDSTLVGAKNRCADNPLWFKVKYRDVIEFHGQQKA